VPAGYPPAHYHHIPKIQPRTVTDSRTAIARSAESVSAAATPRLAVTAC
jgi:hypothetical protein